MRHSIFLAVSLASLLVTGCAGTLESTLRDASESGRVPSDLWVVYDDETPLSGGDRIEVTGEGRLRWWRLRPSVFEASATPETSLYDTEVGPTPTEPAAIETQVTERALLELVRLLVEVEPWEQRAEEVVDEGRLDRRRAVLRASVRAGAESVWEWHDALDDPDGRIVNVRRWAERVIGSEAPPLPVEPPADLPMPTEPFSEGPSEPPAAPAPAAPAPAATP